MRHFSHPSATNKYVNTVGTKKNFPFAIRATDCPFPFNIRAHSVSLHFNLVRFTFCSVLTSVPFLSVLFSVPFHSAPFRSVLGIFYT